jgi:hypothetical protein
MQTDRRPYDVTRFLPNEQSRSQETGTPNLSDLHGKAIFLVTRGITTTVLLLLLLMRTVA